MTDCKCSVTKIPKGSVLASSVGCVGLGPRVPAGASEILCASLVGIDSSLGISFLFKRN